MMGPATVDEPAWMCAWVTESIADTNVWTRTMLVSITVMLEEPVAEVVTAGTSDAPFNAALKNLRSGAVDGTSVLHAAAMTPEATVMTASLFI